MCCVPYCRYKLSTTAFSRYAAFLRSNMIGVNVMQFPFPHFYNSSSGFRSGLLRGVMFVALTVPGSAAVAQNTRAAPEAASGVSARALVRAKRQMVVSANAHASKAGLKILRAGGTAADAMVAVQMVLNLVEPQSSGIGGGAFALYWDAGAKMLETYDGREAAPAAARPDRFFKNGKKPKFFDAIFGGLSVGVPGTLATMEAMHKAHGKLPWSALFAPAIELAERGFAVSPRLHKMLMKQGPKRFGAAARGYFFDADGKPWPAGHMLRNRALAQSFKLIAQDGADAFYKGELSKQILKAVHEAPNHQSDMTAADLAGYQVKQRAPVCVNYRAHKVCGMGLPSSGALTVGQILKLVEPFDLGQGPTDAMNGAALHLLAEAGKLAFADRGRYMADSDYVSVPVAGLLDAAYLAQRRKLINPLAAMKKARPGRPPGVEPDDFGADKTIENKGTSHFTIIDGAGNALSITTTIETAFGSRLMAGGFLLNNELTDFSFAPRAKDGRAIANRVEGGKRPRSSMAPTIMFDKAGEVKLLVGSSGGSRIINYVLKVIVAVVDWKLDVQTAIALPNFGSRGGPFEIERDERAVRYALPLLLRGAVVKAPVMTSGTHAIALRNGALEGGVDPRREGLAVGD